MEFGEELKGKNEDPVITTNSNSNTFIARVTSTYILSFFSWT